MQRNFAACLDFTLTPSNDGQPCHCTPGDSGGWTSYGVTQATWSRWIGRPASVEDMRRVTASAVAGLYRAWYWNTIAGDNLPPGADLMVWDHGVLAGESASARHLQAVLGVTVDGHIGPFTLAMAAKAAPDTLIARLRTAQEQYYHSLRDFAVFGKGWLARVARRAEAATALLPPPA